MAEYWDLFSVADNAFVRTMRRKEFLIPSTMYHYAVEVIPTDKQGHILLTRRSLTKTRGAGLYEFPAGSVLSGETPEAAAERELFEETGLVAEALLRVHTTPIYGSIRRVIFMAYIPDLVNAKVRLQPSETINAKIVTVAQWRQMLRDGSFDPYRVQMYTGAVYEDIDREVGNPAELSTQKEIKIVKSVSVSVDCGITEYEMSRLKKEAATVYEENCDVSVDPTM